MIDFISTIKNAGLMPLKPEIAAIVKWICSEACSATLMRNETSSLTSSI